MCINVESLAMFSTLFLFFWSFLHPLLLTKILARNVKTYFLSFSECLLTVCMYQVIAALFLFLLYFYLILWSVGGLTLCACVYMVGMSN